ncbi:MAG: hypothetical protein ACLVB4_07955 [Butyricicoccus sp.]
MGPFDKGYNGMVSAVEHPEMMGMEFMVKMAAGRDALRLCAEVVST